MIPFKVGDMVRIKTGISGYTSVDRHKEYKITCVSPTGAMIGLDSGYGYYSQAFELVKSEPYIIKACEFDLTKHEVQAYYSSSQGVVWGDEDGDHGSPEYMVDDWLIIVRNKVTNTIKPEFYTERDSDGTTVYKHPHGLYVGRFRDNDEAKAYADWRNEQNHDRNTCEKHESCYRYG